MTKTFTQILKEVWEEKRDISRIINFIAKKLKKKPKIFWVL
ncbi:MAG: hypothetical protein QME61_00075 [Patescibacteria group bacterium]|nr:hypothetical protein [Patescibacteria group bacterium]